MVEGQDRRQSFGAWLSLGRAPALGAGGRRFESCRPDHFILNNYSLNNNSECIYKEDVVTNFAYGFLVGSCVMTALFIVLYSNFK